MADDKLAVAVANAIFNALALQSAESTPVLTDEDMSVFISTLDKAGYALISREPTEADIERMARAINPEWFGEVNGVHVLDNHPKQHERYQAEAKLKARAAWAALVRGDD